MGDRRFKLKLPLIDGFANDLGDERFLRCEVVTEASLREPCFFHQLGEADRVNSLFPE
jgi:hypothetical protein